MAEVNIASEDGQTATEEDAPPPPKCLTITRDEDAGGGYQLAVVEESVRSGGGDVSQGSNVSFAAIGTVDPDGPAAQAGMGPDHVAWRVTHVDGIQVTADTCHGELDKTRSPGRTFTMTIRRPVTGELTFTDASDRSTFRVHVDVRDLSVNIQTAEDGTRRLSVSVPEAMSQRTGTIAMERIQRRMEEALTEMGLLRRALSPEKRAALEQEEQDAASQDVPATEGEVTSRCVVCFDSQRALVLFPCHHLATCHRCTVMVRRVNKCPICRTQIDETKHRSEVNESDIYNA